MKSIFNKYVTKDAREHTLLPPLTVSKEHKVLYFHIAKTGGSSIVELLKNNGLDDGVLSNKRGDYEKKLEYFQDVVENWDDYYKFTFVRNKFDMLISLYNYDRQATGNPWTLSPEVTFEEFVRDHIGNPDTLKKQVLYTDRIDQHYLTHTDDNCMFDFIGYFDNFDRDLNTVCDKLGITNTQIRVNVGNYDRSKRHEYYTEELCAIVRKSFPQEFAYFGWEDLEGEK